MRRRSPRARWPMPSARARRSSPRPTGMPQELLADDRGILVPFRDSEAIAAAVIDYLANRTQMTATRKAAYLLGREMIWSEVAQRYMESFEQARSGRTQPARRRLRPADAGEARLPAAADEARPCAAHDATHGHASARHLQCAELFARATARTIMRGHSSSPSCSKRPSSPKPPPSSTAWPAVTSPFSGMPSSRIRSRFRTSWGINREWIEASGRGGQPRPRALGRGTALGRSRNEGHRNLCALSSSTASRRSRTSPPRGPGPLRCSPSMNICALLRRSRREPDARCPHAEARWTSADSTSNARLAVVRKHRHLR